MDNSLSSNATLDLPRELMLMLFDHLPLTELVHINEVSRQWSHLRSAALLRRKELIIAKNAADLIRIETPEIYSFLVSLVKNDDGSPFVKRRDRLDRHALYTSWMQLEMIDSIIRLMPNLTVIRIRQEGDFAQPWKIKHLLHHYRHQLIEVSIDYTGIFYGVQADWRATRKVFVSTFSSLITTLNGMTELTSLALYLLMPRGMETIGIVRIDLSVASRLKKLKVYAPGFTTWTADCDVLRHICKTFGKENCHFQLLGGMPKFHLNTLLSFCPQVSAALREVCIYTWCDADQTDGLRQFARQFYNLQVLWVKMLMPMEQFAELMAPCKALLYLKVFLAFDRTDYPVALANRLPVDQLPVLPSVKVLDLICFTASHEDYEKMNLDVIFPNVQVIKLTHKLNRCQVCHFTVPRNIAESADWVQSAYSLLIHKCQRLFRAQFAKFSKLTTVEADIGLQMISSSYKQRVSFTRKTLGKMTYDLERGFIHLSLPKHRFHFSNEENEMRLIQTVLIFHQKIADEKARQSE